MTVTIRGLGYTRFDEIGEGELFVHEGHVFLKAERAFGGDAQHCHEVGGSGRYIEFSSSASVKRVKDVIVEVEK